MKTVSRRTSVVVCVLVATSTLIIAGCEGGRDTETVSIQGKVTFNGDPVPEGSVLVFESKDAGASRTTTLSADGAYALSGASAIPPGSYKVAITPPSSDESESPEENETDFSVPQKFQSTSTTDLTVDITTDKRTYDIDFKD